MLRQRIVDAVNMYEPEENDISEMIHHLSVNYVKTVIDQIIDQQDPPLLVANNAIYIKMLDSYSRQWIRVAYKEGNQVKWHGDMFHDLLIDTGLSAREFDQALDDIIIKWRPLL